MPLRRLPMGSGTAWRSRRALGLNPDASQAQVISDLDHMATIGIQAVWHVVALEWGYAAGSTLNSGVAALWLEVVTQAKSRRMPVILQAHGMPGWAIDGAHTNPTPPWHHPDTAGERTNWVAMLHGAIVACGPTNVDYVEINNESNIVEFAANGVSAADTAQLLHDAYVDIKASWPWIRVVGLNMSRNHLGWLTLVYDQMDTLYGAATAKANRYYFDVLGVHPYCGDATSGYDPADTSHADESTALGTVGPDYPDFSRFAALMLAREGSVKPAAFGEFGYATLGSGYFQTSEANRQVWLPRAVKLARDSLDLPVEYIAIYYHRTQDPITNYGDSFNIHGTASETAFGGG